MPLLKLGFHSYDMQEKDDCDICELLQKYLVQYSSHTIALCIYLIVLIFSLGAMIHRGIASIKNLKRVFM